MFGKPSTENSLQQTLDISSLKELVVQLDEHNEESLSGGEIIAQPREEKPRMNVIGSFIILFANPFSY